MLDKASGHFKRAIEIGVFSAEDKEAFQQQASRLTQEIEYKEAGSKAWLDELEAEDKLKKLAAKRQEEERQTKAQIEAKQEKLTQEEKEKTLKEQEEKAAREIEDFSRRELEKLRAKAAEREKVTTERTFSYCPWQSSYVLEAEETTPTSPGSRSFVLCSKDRMEKIKARGAHSSLLKWTGEVKIRSDSYIVVNKVKEVDVYFSEKFESYAVPCGGKNAILAMETNVRTNVMYGWFLSIEDEIRTVFGDVAEALKFLYSKRCTCNGFEVFVSCDGNGNRGLLLPDNGENISYESELRSLVKLMKFAIFQGVKVGYDYIPVELTHFLRVAENSKLVCNLPIPHEVEPHLEAIFAIDHTWFWGSVQRVNFFKKLRKCIQAQVLRRFLVQQFTQNMNYDEPRSRVMLWKNCIQDKLLKSIYDWVAEGSEAQLKQETSEAQLEQESSEEGDLEQETCEGELEPKSSEAEHEPKTCEAELEQKSSSEPELEQKSSEAELEQKSSSEPELEPKTCEAELEQKSSSEAELEQKSSSEAEGKGKNIIMFFHNVLSHGNERDQKLRGDATISTDEEFEKIFRNEFRTIYVQLINMLRHGVMNRKIQRCSESEFLEYMLTSTKP